MLEVPKNCLNKNTNMVEILKHIVLNKILLKVQHRADHHPDLGVYSPTSKRLTK